jgi:hypothetical protein
MKSKRELERIRAEKERVLARKAELDEVIQHLENWRRWEGQHDALKAARLIPDCPKGFPLAEQDYHVDFTNFMQWYQVHGKPAALLEDGITYSWTFHEGVQIDEVNSDSEKVVGKTGLEIKGVSFSTDAFLIWACLEGKLMLNYMDAEQCLWFSDVEGQKITTDMKNLAIVLRHASYNLLRYLEVCKVEVVERKTDYSPTLERIGKKVYKPWERVKYRVIKSLKKVYVGPPRPAGPRSDPDHKVAVHGCWRKLTNPNGVGRGPDGSVQYGRTWVRAHTRWNDKPDAAQRIIYVKEKVDVQA